MQAINYNMYDEGYREGYTAALNALKEVRKTKNNIREYVTVNEHKNRIETRKILFAQRAAGLFGLALSLAGIIVTSGDFGIAFVSIPLSLLVLLSRKKIFQ